MARRSEYKDNFGRWQHIITVNITKQLQEEAERLNFDIAQVVADKLKETHINNVMASYGPRSRSELAKVQFNEKRKQQEKEDREKHGIKNPRLSRKKLSYHHTDTLVNAIDVEVRRKKPTECKVVVVIRDDEYPDDGHRSKGRKKSEVKKVTASQVYDWLRFGTSGGGTYWAKTSGGDRPKTFNYPTPKHDFELHTSEQMKGFLATIDTKHYSRMKKYKKGR